MGGSKPNGGAGGTQPTGVAGGEPTAGLSGSGDSLSMGGSGAAGGEGGGGPAYPCSKPNPLGGGFERCGNGSIHRTKIGECPSKLPRPGGGGGVAGAGQCVTDADCTAMPHGYCAAGVQLPGAFCSYGCVKDSECGAGNICVCGDPVGRCAVADCVSDAECGDGFRCQSYDSSRGCGSLRFACQTPKDACGGDADCVGGLCGVDGTGSFMCAPAGCAVGRPFLVSGQERVAGVRARGDWLIPCEFDLLDLPQSARCVAADAWVALAQMEHASIAAFARFALQLLQLGAPADLIERAARAMADETRHAQLAFGLAGAFSGRAFGPAALDVEHSLVERSLLEVVRLVVREGCIGETVAALEAREAAAHANLPGLADCLHGVADDETRHAELAWRFVGWALEQEPLQVAALLRTELAREVERVSTAPARQPSADELIALRCGVVPQQLRREVREAALREVISPCFEALLARSGAQSLEIPADSPRAAALS